MTTTDSLTTHRALQVINNLRQNLEQTRRENRHLRRRTEGCHPYHYNTAPRILRRALDDAIAFLLIQANGYTASRRYTYELGISERRYSWAMGLLRSARIVSPRGCAWWVDDFVTAEAKVRASYEQLKGQPNALEMIRLYMPKNRQNVFFGRKR